MLTHVLDRIDQLLSPQERFVWQLAQISPPMKQATIARLAGVSRETVNRMLARSRRKLTALRDLRLEDLPVELAETIVAAATGHSPPS